MSEKKRIEQLLPTDMIEVVSAKDEGRHEKVRATATDYKQHVFKIWTNYTSQDYPYIASLLDVANDSANTIDNKYHIMTI